MAWNVSVLRSFELVQDEIGRQSREVRRVDRRILNRIEVVDRTWNSSLRKSGTGRPSFSVTTTSMSMTRTLTLSEIPDGWAGSLAAKRRKIQARFIV
jgi:hypothetical protein